MKAKYAHLSDEKIEEIIDADDHHIERAEEMDGGFVHIYWDCVTCEAEEVAGLRLHVLESTMPGYLPSLRASALHNIRVTDLKAGSFARYSGLPAAVNVSHYVECTSVSIHEDGVEATWVRTNSEDAPFAITYPLDFKLDVVEPLNLQPLG